MNADSIFDKNPGVSHVPFLIDSEAACRVIMTFEKSCLR